MPKLSGHNISDYSKYDNMSKNELEDILRANFYNSPNDASDNDAILYILNLLSARGNKSIAEKIPNCDHAWKSFSENYLPYLEDKQSLFDFNDDKEQTPSAIRVKLHQFPDNKN